LLNDRKSKSRLKELNQELWGQSKGTE